MKEQRHTMIAINNVSKSFGEQVVLNEIDIHFEEGKIYGIIGRNGSGKTVLLKCICGLLAPTKGNVIIDGKAVGKDMDYPDNVGFIIENPSFLKHYSGFKNLKYLASIRRKITDEDIINSMKIVGLDPYDKKKVGKYSLGMRQRLGIAQAIMEKPDILILDEPMNSLDNKGVTDIRNLLLKLRDQGKLIIIASHVKEDIDVLCDEVYGICDGKCSLTARKDSEEIHADMVV